MTDPTIIIDSIVVVGCGEIRLPVSRPKDSKLILQLWLPAKLRGKRDNAKEIRNKTNPILSHLGVMNTGGNSATRIPIDTNIIRKIPVSIPDATQPKIDMINKPIKKVRRPFCKKLIAVRSLFLLVFLFFT